MRLKLVAFVISGAITGLAGALFADLNRFVSPTMFSWQMSGEIIVFRHPRRRRAAVRAGAGRGACSWRWSIFWAASAISGTSISGAAAPDRAVRARRRDRPDRRAGGGA
jgi:hypothetical protein